MSFGKQKAIMKFEEELEKANLFLSFESYWASSSTIVKKNDETF